MTPGDLDGPVDSTKPAAGVYGWLNKGFPKATVSVVQPGCTLPRWTPHSVLPALDSTHRTCSLPFGGLHS